MTLDSDAKGSQLFVNQAGVTEVGQVLVDSIYIVDLHIEI